jgi:hypothetical protein
MAGHIEVEAVSKPLSHLKMGEKRRGYREDKRRGKKR